MNWVRTHASVLLLASAACIIVTVSLILKTNEVPPAAKTTAWGGTDRSYFYTVYPEKNATDTNEKALYTQVQQLPPYAFPKTTDNPDATGTVVHSSAFDTLLSAIGSGKENSSSTEDTSATGDSLLDLFYSLYTHATVNIPTTQNTDNMSPAQKDLYAYGNAAGAYIQEFEDAHTDMATVLQEEFENQGNPAKRAAMLDLANSLTEVGRSLNAMDNVPVQVASMHKKIADSYERMGEKLALVPYTTDEARIEAVLAYNATADTFTDPYVSLVTLFSAYGVTFSEDEPGYVFVFRQVQL